MRARTSRRVIRPSLSLMIILQRCRSASRSRSSPCATVRVRTVALVLPAPHRLAGERQLASGILPGGSFAVAILRVLCSKINISGRKRMHGGSIYRRVQAAPAARRAPCRGGGTPFGPPPPAATPLSAPSSSCPRPAAAHDTTPLWWAATGAGACQQLRQAALVRTSCAAERCRHDASRQAPAAKEMFPHHIAGLLRYRGSKALHVRLLQCARCVCAPAMARPCGPRRCPLAGGVAGQLYSHNFRLRTCCAKRDGRSTCQGEGPPETGDAHWFDKWPGVLAGERRREPGEPGPSSPEAAACCQACSSALRRRISWRSCAASPRVSSLRYTWKNDKRYYMITYVSHWQH